MLGDSTTGPKGPLLPALPDDLGEINSTRDWDGGGTGKERH